MEKPKIQIVAAKASPGAEHDPVTIYGVEITTNEAAWLETFGSEIELKAFLRGLQAGSQMTGGPHLELPHEYS